jgi:hypothetical protein
MAAPDAADKCVDVCSSLMADSGLAGERRVRNSCLLMDIAVWQLSAHDAAFRYERCES